MPRVFKPTAYKSRRSLKYPSRAYLAPRRRAPMYKPVRGAGESNYVDIASANYEMSTTGTITLLNTVAQGVSVSQRVGKKWRMSTLQFRGKWTSGASSTIPDGALLVVYDKRPTGALPAITDVLVSADSKAFNNDVNADRFVIVKRWDKTFAGNTSTPATGKEVYGFDHTVNLRNRLVVNKAAGTGAIGDIEQGALYMITVGDTASGAADAQFTGGVRLRFKDI